MAAKKSTSRFVPFASRTDHTPVWPDGVPFPVEITDGESRFDMDILPGFHQKVRSIKGLAISQNFRKGKYNLIDDDGITVYGVKTMSRPRESGYQMEGRVSIGGKSYRAFTSSSLFLVKGKLVNVAVIHVVKKEAK